MENIEWFKALENKENMSFIIFDVEKFYPSISKELLVSSLQWSRNYTKVTDEEIDVILAARKAFVYVDGEPWTKKGNDIFDVGMGFFDGAEVCEIVGLFMLDKLQKLGINLGIYRDDGLGVSDLSAQGVEKIKKQMSAIFRKNGLEITIQANKKKVQFLDVYLDLQTGEYGPYLKPNDTPIYVHAGSNHPPEILRNIPKGVNRRLSMISATKDIFERAAPVYQAALEKSGYTYKLNFEENLAADMEKARETRKRKSREPVWFNPPYSQTVKTNVGRNFLKLLDKHFPPGNPLHVIFNRSKVKISYRCTKNLARKINAHNSKILKTNANNEVESGGCNCRVKENCPVEGECLKKGVIYQAEVSRNDNIVDTYIGLAATTFKERWSNHCSSFRTRNPKNSTTLSKYVWGLQDKKIEYEVKWRIVGRAPPYNHVTDRCNLCVREKYFIIFEPEKATLNSKNEIAGFCLHKESQLLKKSK